MAFSEQFLQELADRNEIVDLVGQYVHLTPKSGSYWGCCPFHNEKTPSFHVVSDRQMYHCFGCGKGGSVINFVMEVENLSFPDAVEFLARRAGMQVPEDGDRERRDRRDRLFSLNKEAARWFYGELTKPSGQPAQDYIAKRQLSPATVKNFGLGYAPDSFYALTDAMHAKGYQDFELIDAGLANPNKNGKGVHDIFRGRLMFPVIDVRGNVIAFSGRIIGEGEPKYLNTRETPVFSKSRNLFALNLAKKSKNGYILLTEGNIDVVSLHQAGFDSAVASLGTSLTPEQARLIARYASEVIIAYDNDGAGQKAAQRAIGILEPLDIRVRVLKMEGAKDPDEYIKARGPDAFANLLNASENHIEYRLGSVKRKHDLASDEDKVAYLKEAADLIAGLPGVVERQVYAERVAAETGINRESYCAEIGRLREKLLSKARRREERDSVRAVTLPRPGQGLSAALEHPEIASVEKNLVLLMYHDPSLFDGTALKPEDFSNTLLGRFFGILQEHAARSTTLSLAVLSGSFTAEEISYFTTEILQTKISQTNIRKHLENCLAQMNAFRQERCAEEDLRAFAETMRNKKRYGGTT